MRRSFAIFVQLKNIDMKIQKILFTTLLSMSFAFVSAQPKVIAHRGFWDTPGAAQNSIASLVKADSIGCYGSEFDVWLTTDNCAMVDHDGNFKGVRIEDSDMKTISAIRLSNGENVPTLEAYLKRARKLKTKLILEVKTHRDEARTIACADMAMKLVKKYKLTKRTTYIAFSLAATKHLIANAPKGTEVYYLSGDLTPKQLKEIGAAGPDYSWDAIKKNMDWIHQSHALGMKVNVWTVNDENTLRELIDAKVDFITTNNPLLLQKLLKEKKND